MVLEFIFVLFVYSVYEVMASFKASEVFVGANVRSKHL